MHKIFKTLGLLSVVTFSAATFTQTANASSIGVEPLFLEVAPTQSAAVRVRNTSQVDIPVEVLVFRRDVTEAGEQIRIPADDDFIIFPPQAAIKGSATQVFRLRPVIGSIDKSQSYYVSFRQVPAKFTQTPGSGTQLQVVFSFDAAVHVVPRKAKGDFEIKTARSAQMIIKEPTGEIKPRKDGRQIEIMHDVTVPAVEIDVANLGNKYLYLHEHVFTATVTDTSGQTTKHSWVNSGVTDNVAVTLVEPTESRTFKLPLPKTLNVASVTVAVKERQDF